MEDNKIVSENTQSEGNNSTQSEGLQLNEQTISEYLASDEGKKILQPKLDSYFTKGLETWKQNNLDKIVNEKLQSLNPSSTPEQKQIQELQQKLQQLEVAKNQESIKAQALQEIANTNVPASLVDLLVGDSIESTRLNIFNANNEITNLITKAVEQKLGDSSSTPKNSGANNPQNITKDKFMSMTYDERNELYNTNPELYRQLIK
jgi:hypothetical protein